MTTIDWIIVAFVASAGVWGYAQGLIVSALSLTGFALGAFAGSRLAPLLLAQGARSPYAPLVTLMGALVVGSVVAIVLEDVGSSIRRRIPLRATLLDGIGGMLLLAVVGLGLAWIAGAVALQTPGASELRTDIQRSLILGRLNELIPPTGPIINSIARFDPFPQISGPAADVPRPSAGIARTAGVERAGRSVVRVRGTACGLAIAGSGWVAEPQVVVTNAHVIAGEDDTVVETLEGTRLDAQVIGFDPHNDVAVLRVKGPTPPPLARDPDPRSGESVAILGYPENGPYAVTPGRLGSTGTVISVDAYGSGPIRRRMTALRGQVRSGNSGGPAVDSSGRVATTVFAATTRGQPGGFGVPLAIVESDLQRADGRVSTGPCAR
ncbi:MAG: MarP family serine protease [Solirubrobacterales bacterium]